MSRKTAIALATCTVLAAQHAIATPKPSSSAPSSTQDMGAGFLTDCSLSTSRHCNESTVHVYNNTDFTAVIGLTTGANVLLAHDEDIAQQYAIASENYGVQLRVIKKILLDVGNEYGESLLVPCQYSYPNFPIKIAPGFVYDVDVKYDYLDKTCSIDVTRHPVFK